MIGRRRWLVLAACGNFYSLAVSNTCAADDTETSKWSTSAGPGVVSAPRSIGSGRQLTIPVPYVEARYGEWFFATDNPYEGIGVTKKLGSGWELTAALGVDLDERDPGEDPRIRGLPKVNAAVALRGRVEYEGDRWFGSLSIADRLTTVAARGATLTGEFGFNVLVTDRLLGSIGLTARGMDRTWADNFLSVTKEDAASSGLPEYAGKAGALDEGGFGQIVCRINDRWTLFSRLQYTQYDSRAASSPVVSNRRNPLGLLFVTRAF